MPLDTGSMFVAVALPCGQLLPKQIYAPNPPGQALTCHDIQLYLGNVQPAPVLRGVMDSSFLAILRASGAGNALYREERAWVFRLSITSMILSRSG